MEKKKGGRTIKNNGDKYIIINTHSKYGKARNKKFYFVS